MKLYLSSPLCLSGVGIVNFVFMTSHAGSALYDAPKSNTLVAH